MGKTLKRLKQSKWLRIFESVAFFVAGIVGGSLFERWVSSTFDTNTKVILAGLLAVYVVSVVVLIVVSFFARNAEKREEAWLATIGVPAEIVFERAKQGEGSVYRRLSEFVNRASGDDHILVMTQHGQSPPADAMSDQQRKQREEYCEALLRKAKEESIEYRRIVCFAGYSDGPESTLPPVTPWLEDHFLRMLEIKQAKPDKISIDISRKTIGADIFVIPGKVGAIVIDVFDPKTGATATNSSVFFHNPPNKHVIDQLRSWFKENEHDPDTRAFFKRKGE